jgi:hypothetical protein
VDLLMIVSSLSDFCRKDSATAAKYHIAFVRNSGAPAGHDFYCDMLSLGMDTYELAGRPIPRSV